MSWRVRATIAMVLFYLLTVGYLFVNLSPAPSEPVTAGDVPHFHVPEAPEAAPSHNHTPEPQISTTSTAVTPEPAPPVVTVAPEPVVQAPAPAVSVGSMHSCWVVDAKPVCEGAEYHGELGRGIVLPPIVDVQAGDGRTCALTVDGEVWCWGWKLGYGQDYDQIADAVEPVKVQLPGKVTMLAVGLGAECAVSVTRTSQIWCWGFNYSDEHGFALPFYASTDKPVMMWEGKHVHEIRAGHRWVQAHVGFTEGGCGWIHWGQYGGKTSNPLINRPEPMPAGLLQP